MVETLITINDFFDKVLFINLDRRPDRLDHCLKELEKHKIVAERVPGVDVGSRLGNHGCTAAHRKALDLVIENGWERTLILEDDIEFRYEDTQERFSEYIQQVPDDWFMVYLAGHYGDMPKRWVAHNVIEFGYMKTTTAYGVKLSSAIEMAPSVHGIGPIDEIYTGFAWHKPCYIVEPRLAVQYNNLSDIQGYVMNNGPCMEDDSHVARLEGRP